MSIQKRALRFGLAILVFFCGSFFFETAVDPRNKIAIMYAILPYLILVVTYTIIGWLLWGDKKANVDADQIILYRMYVIIALLFLLIPVIPLFGSLLFAKYLSKGNAVILFSLILGASLANIR